jgi:hypothetical protein
MGCNCGKGKNKPAPAPSEPGGVRYSLTASGGHPAREFGSKLEADAENARRGGVSAVVAKGTR